MTGPTMIREKSNDLATYEVREGEDGTWGIFLRNYHVRLATFVPNSAPLRKLLKETFDHANKVGGSR